LPARPETTLADYRRLILGRLVASMITARFADAVQAPVSPLVGASASEGRLVRPVNVMNVSVSCGPTP
jgi:hypothetical protein